MTSCVDATKNAATVEVAIVAMVEVATAMVEVAAVRAVIPATVVAGEDAGTRTRATVGGAAPGVATVVGGTRPGIVVRAIFWRRRR